ncbi:MAG: ABC transporter substrate-binding protein [Proteobacteria bacterium]|nr:ABC transporter substrate-binding protein [Pseudomonadota bacterium]
MKSALLRSIAAFGLAFGLAAPAYSADLLVLTDDVPAGLDFDGPTSSTIQSYSGIVNLLEPLVYFQNGAVNSEGVQLLDFQKFEGRLAESWSFDKSTLTWTMKLRRDVKGCDGQTFDADDVIYTYARAKTVSGAAPIGWFLASVSSIDGFTPAVFGGGDAQNLGDEVKKIDDYTVTIRQSAPNQLFLPVLTIFAANLLDKETMEDNATAEDKWSHTYNNNVNAPGFGPWCLTEWRKGEEMRLRANPDYYRGKAAFDRVILRKVPQSSNRTVILRSGQAHIVERLTPKEYDNLSRASGVKVMGTFGNENLFLHLNYNVKPFDDVRIRRAIAHAIPYDRIIQTGYFGLARKWDGAIPSSYPGFHKSSTQYEYSPDKAKALLAEAGFPGGRGLEQFSDSFKITYQSERESVLGPVATVLRSALAEVGIPVLLDPIPASQYGDRELVKKDLPLGLTDHVKPIGVDAGYGVQLSYVSTAKGGILNSMNYVNDTVDAKFFEMLVEGDVAKRNGLLVEIQDQLMIDVAVAPIVEFKTIWAISDKIKGVTWHPDNSLHWYDYSPAN